MFCGIKTHKLKWQWWQIEIWWEDKPFCFNLYNKLCHVALSCLLNKGTLLHIIPFSFLPQLFLKTVEKSDKQAELNYYTTLLLLLLAEESNFSEHIYWCVVRLCDFVTLHLSLSILWYFKLDNLSEGIIVFFTVVTIFFLHQVSTHRARFMFYEIYLHLITQPCLKQFNLIPHNCNIKMLIQFYAATIIIQNQKELNNIIS